MAVQTNTEIINGLRALLDQAFNSGQLEAAAELAQALANIARLGKAGISVSQQSTREEAKMDYTSATRHLKGLEAFSESEVQYFSKRNEKVAFNDLVEERTAARLETAQMLDIEPNNFETIAPPEELKKLLKILQIEDPKSLEARKAAFIIALSNMPSGYKPPLPSWQLEKPSPESLKEARPIGQVLQEMAEKRPDLAEIISPGLEKWQKKKKA